ASTGCERHEKEETKMKLETEVIEKADESNPNSESYINKVEVARRMNIKVRTVDNWMRRKFIPYYKLGHTVLFRWSEIENHIGKACRVLAHGHQPGSHVAQTSTKERTNHRN